MLAELTEQIRAATDPVRIVGGDSKGFYGHDLSHLDTLSTANLTGVISYEPSELVIHVEAGCTIESLLALLDSENQMLGFDPIEFGGSTIGGTVAAGISGSRRPYRGACRDFLLGVTLLDGNGDLLKFGGQVMKNVAGYDVSRLLAGSLGCLGVITDVSFKVLPKPDREITVRKPLAKDDRLLSRMAREGVRSETTAVAYWQGALYVRYTGSESSVSACVTAFDGEQVDNDFWRQLDSLSLFKDQTELWRVSTEANCQSDGFDEALLIDWGGAQRWLANKPKASQGHVTCLRSSSPVADVFTPLPQYQLAIHQRLKAKFDPRGIFNPGKMYPSF